MYAAKYMEAYWVQLVLTLSPLFVALINRFLLHQQLPEHFWLAVSVIFAGVCGCGCVAVCVSVSVSVSVAV